MSSALADKFFTTSATWEALLLVLNLIKEKKYNLLMCWIPDTCTPQHWGKYALTGLSELMHSDAEDSESHLPGLTFQLHHFLVMNIGTFGNNVAPLHKSFGENKMR